MYAMASEDDMVDVSAEDGRMEGHGAVEVEMRAARVHKRRLCCNVRPNRATIKSQRMCGETERVRWLVAMGCDDVGTIEKRTGNNATTCWT